MVRHKRRYWKCVDCGSEINDENMLEPIDKVGIAGMAYAEYCYGCVNYNPEVVIAYD